MIKDTKGNSWYYRCYYNDMYGNRKQRESKLYCTKGQAQEEEMKYENYTSTWFIFGGVPISKETIKLRKNKFCKQANLKQIRIQDFRHSCASLLINNNASITLVSKYLGHSSITTTLNIYAHMFKNQLDGIINVINKLEIEKKQGLNKA